ncbi:MAG: translation elongation factor g [candidate division WS6 bacterium 36_33]|uniref:Elongation factor G n=1 Tax=candidate division WS6 bacterium 36_33 TaxID=1641388 RepID=A0A101GZ85_9BACT|nr:MAG: translation elongation factor g [candidate division WS6 bacterium 36_33]
MDKSTYNVKMPLNRIRNIGIIAHIDAGKTTTTERLLYFTGQLHKIGEVHEGAATTDFMEQEQERGITIMSAAVTCFWDYDGERYRINIIDTPGHVDFTAEVERSLRVLDGAVVIFDGRKGVEPQSETVWRQANKYGVPRICFMNKINLIGGDFEKSFATIRNRLSKKAVAVTFPIGKEQDLYGYVDLVKMKAYEYKGINTPDLIEVDIPEDIKNTVESLRKELVEILAEQEDSLMEKYFAGEELPTQELYDALRKGTLAGEIFPVLGGDSRTAMAKTLLDYITICLPSPVDVPAIKGIDPKTHEPIVRKAEESEPFSALVFKIVNDPHIGNLSYFRVYSGKIESGSYVLNSTKGIKERVSRLILMHADDREEVDSLRVGDIGAIVGLKDSTTGDTLCDGDNPIILERITFAEPVVSQAIEPATKSDEEKMSEALGRLVREDPTFHVSTNQETGQTIIHGMGELHLEIMVDRMKREFGVVANVGKPQVAYRETIKKVVEQAEGKYIKQSGGKGQYGHCWLRLEPNEAGKGFEFINEIKGGSIPREYIPSVQKGVEEAMKAGVVAGYPVVDIKVALFDGSYHEVDSSEAAFKVAGSMAFKDGCRRGDPILLEPIMKVEVETPDSHMGDVTGSLSSKRGQIQGTESLGNGISKIIAHVPLSELFGYTNELRSITSGRGSANIEPSHYAEVPKNIAEEISGKEG